MLLEKVFPLLLINFCFCFGGDFVLEFSELQFLLQQLHQQVGSFPDMIQFQQALFIPDIGIQVAGYKMNQERRVFNIPQDDGSFGRNIRRQLNDISGQVLDIGHIGIEILILGRFFFFQLLDFRLEIRIVGKNIFNQETVLSLDDDRCAAIRHLDQLHDPGYRTDFFQIGYFRVFCITVLLGDHPNQFIAFVGISYGPDTFVPSYGDG